MSKPGSNHGQPPTIGRFLFSYIHKKGVRHAFGLPGDFALPTFAWLEQSKIECITMTHEPSVGFAADAYARVNGLGLACVTYCVGGLNMLNSIAGAYAERSPVIVISGGPSAKDREGDPLLHHKVKTFETQRRIYEEVTCANTILLNPKTAAAEIARVVDAVIENCRPGYIEVPYDIVGEPIVPFESPKPVKPTTDSESLHAAIAECTEMINEAKQPVILAGVELHRFKLTDIVVELAERFTIPMAASLLSKSVIRENHPLYIGTYSGALSEPPCREYVDKSDCVIMLGTFITDMFLGMNTAQLSRRHSILATSEQTRVRFHRYDNIFFSDFLNALGKAKVKKRTKFDNPNPVVEAKPLAKAELHDPLRSADVFRILSLHIDDNSVIVTDVGDSLFGAIGLRTGKRNEFIAGAYYCSMGLAVPGTIGVGAADPTKRVFGIVGDGAFQMTGLELSTAAQLGQSPVILLLNNDGYGTQRFILDGKFNDIRMWDYAKVCDLIRAGEPDVVETKGQLDGALRKATSSNKISLIEIRLQRLDRSAPLKTLTDEMAKLRNPATRKPPSEKSATKKTATKK